MATVKSLMEGKQIVRVAPTEVDCYYQVIYDAGGNKLVHLSTFGSITRQSRPKSSQSLQIDRQMAKELVALLNREFPDLTP